MGQEDPEETQIFLGGTITYAGGGAGGFFQSGIRGTGGAGGGGAGGTNSLPPIAGTNGLGGGGGGGGIASAGFAVGATGGSGVVIVRYVAPSAPGNTSFPAISGTKRVGETLSATFGSWTGSPSSFTYSYQWKRASTSGGSYINIDSETRDLYVLDEDDVGKFIKVSVVASNMVGQSISALSSATTVINDLPDSVVPTTTSAVSTETGFIFTVSNYSSDYSYSVTTSTGSVARVAGDVTVTGLGAGSSATVSVSVSRSGYKPKSQPVTGFSLPAVTTTTVPITTTTVPAAVTIDIQAPGTTVPQGQASIGTIAPTTTTAVASSETKTTDGLSETGVTTSTVLSTKTRIIIVSTTTSVPQLVAPTNSVVAPDIAQVSTGESALDIDGVRSNVVVTREQNQVVVSSDGLQAVLSGLNKEGETRALDSDGNLRLAGGDVVKINLGGFQPGSDIDVWLFSTPKHLGTAVVGAGGTVVSTFVIPKNVESGPHSIAVTAELPNGKSATFTLGVVVGQIAKTSKVTRVLIAIPIAMAIGAGFILPNQARRRRRKGHLA